MILNPMDDFRHNRAVRAESYLEAQYVATVNVPGYLPMDDEPPVFETAQDAWAYLYELRCDVEEDLEPAPETTLDVPTYTECVTALRYAMESKNVGTVYGSTPGYEGDHDLGLAYSVDRYVADPIG